MWFVVAMVMRPSEAPTPSIALRRPESVRVWAGRPSPKPLDEPKREAVDRRGAKAQSMSCRARVWQDQRRQSSDARFRRSAGRTHLEQDDGIGRGLVDCGQQRGVTDVVVRQVDLIDVELRKRAGRARLASKGQGKSKEEGGARAARRPER
jgi:hypothetical protein